LALPVALEDDGIIDTLKQLEQEILDNLTLRGARWMAASPGKLARAASLRITNADRLTAKPQIHNRISRLANETVAFFCLQRKILVYSNEFI